MMGRGCQRRAPVLSGLALLWTGNDGKGFDSEVEVKGPVESLLVKAIWEAGYRQLWVRQALSWTHRSSTVKIGAQRERK